MSLPEHIQHAVEILKHIKSFPGPLRSDSTLGRAQCQLEEAVAVYACSLHAMASTRFREDIGKDPQFLYAGYVDPQAVDGGTIDELGHRQSAGPASATPSFWLPLAVWSQVARYAREHLGAHGGETTEGEFVEIPLGSGSLQIFNGGTVGERTGPPTYCGVPVNPQPGSVE